MKSQKIVIVGAAIGAAASVAVSAAFGISAASAASSPLAVLNQGERVKFPVDGLDSGDPAIRPDTLVELGEDGAGKYYAALDEIGDVCVITYLDLTGLAASACMPEENFAKYGNALAVSSRLPSGAMVDNEMYLLPDGIELSRDALDGTDLVFLTDNLIVGTSASRAGSEISVGTRSGEDFVISLYKPDNSEVVH